MFAETIAVLLAGIAVVAYFERKALKAEVITAETRVKSVYNRVTSLLRSKEAEVRAKITTDIDAVIAASKAEAEKIEAEIKSDVNKAEGAVKGVVERLEAEIKKVL